MFCFVAGQVIEVGQRVSGYQDDDDDGAATAEDRLPAEDSADIEVQRRLPAEWDSPAAEPSGRRHIRHGVRARRRRHDRMAETSSAEDGAALGGRRRHRRSAIGWIQAAVRLCDTGRSTDRRCRRVDINAGRTRISIRLEER